MNKPQKTFLFSAAPLSIALACTLCFFSCSSGDEDPGPDADDTPFVAIAGSNKSDMGRAIAADASGNSYVAGSFVDPITFGDIELTSDEDGGANLFVVKYNSKGVPQWAKRATTSDGNIYAYGISLDGAGNTYVAGSFTSDATFENITKTGAANDDIFLAKYNSDGVLQWVKQFGGEGIENGLEIRTDAAGNTYMTGSFSGTASFGEASLTSYGGLDAFVAKFSKDGDVVWAKHVGGGVGNDQSTGIALSSSAVYITGNMTKNVTINGTAFNSSYGTSAFVAKYNTSGEFSWANRAGGYSSAGSSITVDSEGNAYAIGTLSTNTTFGDFVLTYSQYHYAFLTKYTSSGSVAWAKQFPGDGAELLVVTGPSDKLYAAGRFSGSVSFNPSHQYTSAGFIDVYLARFDSNGNVDWSMKGGGTDFEAPLGAAMDGGGNLFTTGFFHGTAIFNTQSGGVTSAGAHDLFVWKVHP